MCPGCSRGSKEARALGVVGGGVGGEGGPKWKGQCKTLGSTWRRIERLGSWQRGMNRLSHGSCVENGCGGAGRPLRCWKGEDFVTRPR